MTVELLQTLSVVSFIVAGVLFLLAIALFFLLNVPKLFGDLTGATARKAIESIRMHNEGSDVNSSNLSNSGKGKSKQNKPSSSGGEIGTEKFSTTKLSTAQETTILGKARNETTILSRGQNETTILAPPPVQPEEVAPIEIPAGEIKEFTIVEELGFTSSSEIIE